MTPASFTNQILVYDIVGPLLQSKSGLKNSYNNLFFFLKL